MSSTAWNNAHLAYRSRRLIWLSGALIVAIIVWATWAKLEEVVVGEGKVVPSLSVQTIQSLEGGLVKQVLVTQGERVELGQPIAILDDTRFKASFQESAQQAQSLLAQKQRLEAELISVQVQSSQVDWREQVNVVTAPFVLEEGSHNALFNERANYLERIGQLNAELEESTLRIEQQAPGLQRYLECHQNIAKQSGHCHSRA